MVKINQLGPGKVSSAGAIKVALLSITDAPASPFAKGSRYYDETEKKIYEAIVADSWEGALVSDPQMIPIYYLFNGALYTWDGSKLKEELNDVVDVLVDDVTIVGADKKARFNTESIQIRVPFLTKSNVLSSTAKRVVSNSLFFIFENGDVSSDGKTVLKENTVDGSVVDLYADDDYVFFMYATSVKVYTLGEDGTFTLARTFTISGPYTWFEGENQ